MYADTSKIRVVDCRDNSLWYRNKVGEVYSVEYWGQGEAYVKTGDSYNTGNFIQVEDLEIVREMKK